MKTEVKNSATTARTSRRSALTIMLRLVGLVRPLAGFMILAILMGVLGNLAATFLERMRCSVLWALFRLFLWCCFLEACFCLP